jgi:hypothetical protein
MHSIFVCIVSTIIALKMCWTPVTSNDIQMIAQADVDLDLYVFCKETGNLHWLKVKVIHFII